MGVRPALFHFNASDQTGGYVAFDNYSVEVLPKMGLGYDVLSKLNPKLVMMSMSAFGTGSAFRDCRAARRNHAGRVAAGAGKDRVAGRRDDGGAREAHRSPRQNVAHERRRHHEEVDDDADNP